MKKLIYLLLILTIAIGITGCGTKKASAPTKKNIKVMSTTERQQAECRVDFSLPKNYLSLERKEFLNELANLEIQERVKSPKDIE